MSQLVQRISKHMAPNATWLEVNRQHEFLSPALFDRWFDHVKHRPRSFEDVPRYATLRSLQPNFWVDCRVDHVLFFELTGHAVVDDSEIAAARYIAKRSVILYSADLPPFPESAIEQKESLVAHPIGATRTRFATLLFLRCLGGT